MKYQVSFRAKNIISSMWMIPIQTAIQIPLLVLNNSLIHCAPLVKYSSTLEEKFCISAQPCNILYIIWRMELNQFKVRIKWWVICWYLCKGFIKIFNKRATGEQKFVKQTSLWEKLCSRWHAKSSPQPVNLPGARPLIKPLFVNESTTNWVGTVCVWNTLHCEGLARVLFGGFWTSPVWNQTFHGFSLGRSSLCC